MEVIKVCCNLYLKQQENGVWFLYALINNKLVCKKKIIYKKGEIYYTGRKHLHHNKILRTILEYMTHRDIYSIAYFFNRDVLNILFLCFLGVKHVVNDNNIYIEIKDVIKFYEDKLDKNKTIKEYCSMVNPVNSGNIKLDVIDKTNGGV